MKFCDDNNLDNVGLLLNTTFRKISKGLVLLVLYAIIELLSVRSSLACTCAELPAVSTSLDGSDAVFSAEVADIQDNQERRVTLMVLHIWKGKLNNWVFITTESGNCGFNFEKGERYLIYASGPMNALKTSNCTRTRVLDQATSDFERLFRLTAKPPIKGEETKRLIMEVIVNNSILAYLRPEHVEYLAIGTRVIVERVEEDYAYLIRNGQSPYMYKSHLRPTGDCLVKFNNEWISPVERVRRECLASGLIEYKNFWVTSNTQHRWRSKAEYQEWLLKLEVDRQYINNSAPYYIPCPPDKRTYIYTVAQPRNLNEE